MVSFAQGVITENEVPCAVFSGAVRQAPFPQVVIGKEEHLKQPRAHQVGVAQQALQRHLGLSFPTGQSAVGVPFTTQWDGPPFARSGLAGVGNMITITRCAFAVSDETRPLLWHQS